MRDKRVLIGGVTLAAISGLVLACPPGGDPDGAVSEASSNVWQDTLGDGGASTHGALKGVISTGPDDGTVVNETIEIISENGKTRVIRNGKELSDDEIAKLHNQLGVFGDRSGGPLAGFFNLNVSPSLDADGTLSLQTRVIGPGDEPLGVAAMQPKVMVGITMAQPDEALRAHLAIGDRPVIMLDGVIDGLPAAEAGLKKYDIILAIDGNDDDVTPEHLHEVLMTKKPGDELKLLVLRGGEKETYSVKLGAYNAQTLGIAPGAGAAAGDEHTGPDQNGSVSGLTEMVESLRDAGLDDENIAGIQRQIEEAIRQAMGAQRVVNGKHQIIVPGPDGRILELKMPDMQNMQVPDALQDRLSAFNSGPSADFERRLSDLERRVDDVSSRLEERMDKALGRLEELTERLERKLRDGEN